MERSGRGGREEARATRFPYQKRDGEALRRRAESQGGGFDTYIKSDIKLFSPKDGDNTIRILPPTWDRPEHWGLDVWVHYNIGPDNSAYLCLSKMKDEDCPICREASRATREGDADYAAKLKPTRRVLVWIIDRANERDGPIIWSMPQTFDSNLCKLARDPRTGEVVSIDHPDEGYDIFFQRKGQSTRTEYIGLQIDRRPSSLGNDRWLDIAVQQPLTEVLNYYSPDHIESVFLGKSSRAGGESTDNPTPREARRTEDSAPARRQVASRPEETWESIHQMTWDEMCDLAESRGLNIDTKSAKDEADLADWICELMKLTPQAQRRRVEPEAPESAADRLRRMREGRS